MVGSKLARSAEIERGDRDHDERKPHRDRKDAADVDAHQLRGFEVVGGGAEGAAERRAVEDELRNTITAIADTKRQQRHDADRDAAAKRDRGGLDRARTQALAVGGESLATARSG